ncbi:MAG: ketopantoate reductase family protein, partial [Chloroflexota bacterium]
WPGASDASSWVAGVQNGLVKDDVLREAFGEQRVVGAVTILGAGRQASGEVTVSSRGMTYLGEFPEGVSERVNEAVAALRSAEIPAEATRDIQSVLWSKECNAVGVFGVSVLTRGAAPVMLRNPELLRAYLSLLRECAAVAAASGVQLGDYAGFPIRTYVERSDEETLAVALAQPAPPASARTGATGLPSMTQDLLAGRPMEADAVFADMVARAEKAGVPVPRIEIVRDLICGLNRTLAAA